MIPEIDLEKTRLDFKNLAHRYSAEASVDIRKAEHLACIAIHEAGHAVGCLLVGFAEVKIYLRPTWGLCVSDFNWPSFLIEKTGEDGLKWWMESVTILCNAGLVATCLARGLSEYLTLASFSDIHWLNDAYAIDDVYQAQQHLARLDKRHQEYRLRIKTYALFRDPQVWAAVCAIAEKLLFKKRLNQKAVMELWQPFAPKHPGYWLDL